MPVFYHTHSKKRFLMLTWNCLCFNVWPLPLILSADNTEKGQSAFLMALNISVSFLYWWVQHQPQDLRCSSTVRNRNHQPAGTAARCNPTWYCPAVLQVRKYIFLLMTKNQYVYDVPVRASVSTATKKRKSYFLRRQTEEGCLNSMQEWVLHSDTAFNFIFDWQGHF